MLLSTLLTSTLLTATLYFTARASPAKHSDSESSGSTLTSAAADPSSSSSSGSGSFTNARFTFYDVGLGACGETNKPSDFIVALNSKQFGDGYPGPNCKKEITITYKGKTHDATIMDECPGCPYGGLDFSRGLFDFFADEDLGVIYGEWSFKDGSGSSNSSDGNGGGDSSSTHSGSGGLSGGPTSTPGSMESSAIPSETASLGSQHGHCGHCGTHGRSSA